MGKRRTEISKQNDDVFRRNHIILNSATEIAKEIMNSLSVEEIKLIFSC